jgi:hypothetical protein
MTDITPSRYSSLTSIDVTMPSLADATYSIDVTNSSGVGSGTFLVGAPGPTQSDKLADLVSQLGTKLQAIDGSGEYWNTIVPDGIRYGVENFNALGLDPEVDYPSINLICNDLAVPEFSTQSCSRVEAEIQVHGYLWKNADRETDLTTYQNSLHFCKDLRTAFRDYLNGISVTDVDADLFSNEITQSISYSTNFIVVSLRATLLFDEKLGE